MSENKNIKMTLADGTVIEGMAEELAKLQKLLPVENAADKTAEVEESLVGKYVMFTDVDGTDLTVGKAYKINDESESSVGVTDDVGDGQRVRKDFENSRFEYEIVDEIPELKVGDKVRLVIREGETPKHLWGSVRNGDVGTVREIRPGIIKVDFPRQSYWSADREELAKIEHEVITEFKPGDYAKVIGSTYYDDISEGTIVKVIGEKDSDGNYEISLANTSKIDYDYAKPTSLEKLELSEQDVLFLKNGRDIGEFKEGDIAEVVKSPCADAVGTLVEVVSIGDDSIRANGYKYATGKSSRPYVYSSSYLKLIALAEKRADAVA